MGIGFDVDGWDADTPSWSYSGFNRFRHRLCQQIGIDLDSMIGFGGKKKWPSVKKEALIPLLNHSDCDGELSPEECATVAPRLRQVLADLPKEVMDYDLPNGEKLAACMDAAAALKKPLVFC